MTAVESMPAPTTTGPGGGTWLLAALPQADLLPPSIIAREKLRQARRLAVMLVVGALALIALLWVWAAASVSAAQGDVDNQAATRTGLLAESAKYVEVPQTKAALASAQTTLATAMANDVQWAHMLADLAAMPSGGVVLTQVAGTYGGTTDPSGKAPVAGGAAGTMSFGGTAPSMNAIATWLDNIAKAPWYTNPYLSNATRGGTTTVQLTWVGSADLTPAVLSHAFDRKDG